MRFLRRDLFGTISAPLIRMMLSAVSLFRAWEIRGIVWTCRFVGARFIRKFHVYSMILEEDIADVCSA